jgi:phospholipase C
MSHSWESAHADYDEGRMDGFVYCEGSTQTMGYFERGDLELYWQVADKYVLCDRYSSSVMSQSAPNHLYLVAASCGGIINNKVPKTLDFPPVFKQLDEEGITWKVYTKDPNSSWFRNFSYVQNMSNLDKNFARNDEFSKDVESGNLCQVSWIVGAPGGDEHPPANVQLG